MFRRHRYQFIFGIIGLAATAVLFLTFTLTTTWHWFAIWLLSASIVALVFYGIDKGFAKAGTVRIPEIILHLMSLIGGFIGAFLGMIFFRHKTNFKAHPLFIPIMIISAVIYGALAYLLFIR